ncbi:MAG: ribonuclease III [candidate division Zixibacteria bacterium]
MSFSFFKRFFHASSDQFDEIEKVTGYQFSNRELLKRALSHRSSVEDQPSNERLEHLGDAVLGLVVSEFLFNKFPEMDEGDLTKLKASLVNEAVLWRIAGKFRLGNFIFLSKEEEKSGGRNKPSIVSDATEALLGAIYLDGGLEKVRKFIERFILNDLENLANDKSIYNYKGELLEMMQGKGLGMPRYEIIDEKGPDHMKVFDIAVSVEGVRYGDGRGSTKKEAEQKAAEMALEVLGKENKQPSID